MYGNGIPVKDLSAILLAIQFTNLDHYCPFMFNNVFFNKMNICTDNDPYIMLLNTIEHILYFLFLLDFKTLDDTAFHHSGGILFASIAAPLDRLSFL